LIDILIVISESNCVSSKIFIFRVSSQLTKILVGGRICGERRSSKIIVFP